MTGSNDPIDDEAASPLAKVVYGGVNIEQEMFNGPMRMLSIEEVQEIAVALRAVDREELRSRLDPNAFNEAHIYPGHQQWKVGEIEWVLDDFEKLVDFFETASECQEVVLLELLAS